MNLAKYIINESLFSGELRQTRDSGSSSEHVLFVLHTKQNENAFMRIYVVARWQRGKLLLLMVINLKMYKL